MPPYNTDDEEEVEMECVEVMAEEDHNDNDDDEEEEELAAPSTAGVVEEDDDSTEEDNDDDDDEDEDTDSEKEDEPTKPAAPPPKMRIKLKMPPKPAAPASSNNPLKPEASTTKTAISTHNDEVVLSVGGSKPKPNLPLQRLSLLKKLPSAARTSDNDTGSVGSTAAKPKSRIRSLKLPLSKLPLAKKLKEDNNDDEIVAQVVSSGSTRTTPGGGTYSKRRSMHPNRPVKLPPLTSPGLLQPGANNKDSGTSSAQLFDQAMQAAGYTQESRSQRPHRGSSIQRTVGDLFDSNVKLTMHFPALVPPDLWEEPQEKDADGDVVMDDDDEKKEHVTANDLLEQLRQTMRPSTTKKSAISFNDMLPISLTVPYPESYIQESLEYVKAVEEREKAIVVKQEAEQEAEFNGTEPPNHLEVPPIPLAPEPPRLHQVNTATTASDKHPLYPPKQANLVAHLDPQMFHITQGRYFGLLSNNVADPNFCGPNALATTAGNALATAGSSSSGTPLTLSSVLFSNHPSALAAAASSLNPSNSTSSALAVGGGNVAAAGSTGPSGAASATNATVSATEATLEGGKSSPVTTAVPVTSTVESSAEDVVVTATVEEAKSPLPTLAGKDKKKGPAPTASSSALRKIMEEGGPAAQDMRQAIIKAAVYFSKTSGHGHSFVAPTGEVFPDIGKAFAAYAGIKPCERCKSNKQGSYHCRLRRKHQEVDYDGGDSSVVLKELLSQPLESLAPSVTNATAES